MLFLDREKQRQESFKLRHWPELVNGQGCFPSGRTNPCLLPRGHEAKAFFPPAAAGILDYCRKNRIPIQADARNLKSSLVSCLNSLYPLRGNPTLAGLALEPALPGLSEVQQIEFLFPGAEEARRQNRADSPGLKADAAVWWQDASGSRCLSLICWKYTEASYGTCGGFRSWNNHHQGNCLQMDLRVPNPERYCYLFREVGPRMAWDLLPETGIRFDAFQGVTGCPFRGPFYQFMREFMLAADLRRTEKVDQVDVVFVVFRENRRITQSPRHLAHLGDNLILAWNLVLKGVPKLRFVHAEDIVSGLRCDRSGQAKELLRYLGDRYGFSREISSHSLR